jgi:hypothetical protein
VKLGRVKVIDVNKVHLRHTTFKELQSKGYDSIALVNFRSVTQYVVFNEDQVTDVHQIA